MELASGVGYLVVLLAAFVLAYALIKCLPLILAVSAVFASFQWVFPGLALPPNGPEHWYQAIGFVVFLVAAIVAACVDFSLIKTRLNQVNTI